MACGSCVDKLAYRLMFNHKMDMIRAYEVAEKGIERHEANELKPPFKVQTLSKEEMEMLGFDPDYSQTCIMAYGPCSSAGVLCITVLNCPNNDTTCTGGCPAPLPNSSYVSNNCVYTAKLYCLSCAGSPKKCSSTKQCTTTSGACYYNCNAGYVWNPVTSTCDLIPAGGLILLKQVGVGL